jgi:hypothetical protein
MKLRSFFSYLGIFAILLLSWFIWQTFHDVGRIKQTRERANLSVNRQDGSSTKAEIGEFQQIEGTDILRAELYAKEDDKFMPSYTPSKFIQNYIFFDSTKQRFYPLKSENTSILLSITNITETNSNNEINSNLLETKKPRPVGFAYVIVDQDTNNDKRINQDDLQKIAISDVSGLRFKVLIDRVDKFKGVSIVKNNRVFLIYLSESKIKAAEIDVRSQEIISNSEFSRQP